MAYAFLPLVEPCKADSKKFTWHTHAGDAASTDSSPGEVIGNPHLNPNPAPLEPLGCKGVAKPAPDISARASHFNYFPDMQ